MPSSIANSSAVDHLPRAERSDTLPNRPVADLRKAETDDWNQRIGRVVDGLRLSQGWSLKEFAAVLGRNERQVARWINGKEHAQLSVVFAVPALRRPLVIGLARLAGTSMELETVIRIRDVA